MMTVRLKIFLLLKNWSFRFFIDKLIFLGPGDFEFVQSAYVVKESIGTLEIECKRNNGASGDVSVEYKTSDITEDNKDSHSNVYTGITFLQ